ncbi:MAG: hypothetical protein OER96_08065 [Gammaproteobacteria bacterium]|nr:hypothetical protein [Gammaproteobacteria bacterium]
MPKCPFYQSCSRDDNPENNGVDPALSAASDVNPSCQHRCYSGESATTPPCQGDFTKCKIQFDDQQLSEFVGHESRSRRVEFICNNGDAHGAMKIESDSWLALELIRRFGRRQKRGIETTLTIKNNRFSFSRDTQPMAFGDSMVFPLDLLPAHQ